MLLVESLVEARARPTAEAGMVFAWRCINCVKRGQFQKILEMFLVLFSAKPIAQWRVMAALQLDELKPAEAMERGAQRHRASGDRRARVEAVSKSTLGPLLPLHEVLIRDRLGCCLDPVLRRNLL